MDADVTTGRFGGDGFVLLGDGSGDPPDPTALAIRVAEALHEPLWVTGKRVTLTASVGIAVAAGPGQTTQDLLRNAYAASYRAKELGRSRYVVFDESILTRVETRFNVEADLRAAIDHNELIVHYQPQVDVKSGVLAGFEALVRWPRPERGLVGPDEFIAVAEESGLIIPLGIWVLEQACHEAANWPEDRRHMVMSVNVSARQLADPNFFDVLARVLNESGLDPACLCLEVTESVLLVASDAMMLTLEALRQIGVLVSIDDFGTGYGSLTYLVQLRPDAIKIDKSFIQGLHAGSVNSAIVSAIVTLAHDLQLTVTAEGVETHEELSLLQSLACDHAQGFLYAKALPAEQVHDLLAEVPSPWGFHA